MIYIVHLRRLAFNKIGVEFHPDRVSPVSSHVVESGNRQLTTTNVTYQRENAYNDGACPQGTAAATFSDNHRHSAKTDH
jgi:hypothetical protein